MNSEQDRRDTFRLVLDFVLPLEEQEFRFVEEIFEMPIERLGQVLTTSFQLQVTVTRDKPLAVEVFQNSMSGYDVDFLPFLFSWLLEPEHLQYLQCNLSEFQIFIHSIKRKKSLEVLRNMKMSLSVRKGCSIIMSCVSALRILTFDVEAKRSTSTLGCDSPAGA